jgi:hypothetical protein
MAWAHLGSWSAGATIGRMGNNNLYLVTCKHRGERDRPFADLGLPDQLRGNSAIPVIENATLGHRPALPRLTTIGRKEETSNVGSSMQACRCPESGRLEPGNLKVCTEPKPRRTGSRETGRRRRSSCGQ